MDTSKTYKGIIFDIDGTLINTDLYVVMNYVHMFSLYAPLKMPDLKTLISFSGPSLEDVFGRYFPGFPMESLIKEFRSYCAMYQNGYSSLYPGEIEALDCLYNNGIKMGVCSNKASAGVKSGLDYFHLNEYFSSVYPIDRCLRGKPVPWPLEACRKELGLEKEEVLYIGDDASDYKAAVAAGIDCGLMRFGLKSLELKPDYDFYSYEDIKRRVIYGK